MPIRCALFENSATAIPDTVENLKRNGGRVLVVEAGRTFVVDRDKMVAAAERLGVVIVGRGETQEEARRHGGTQARRV